MNDRHLVMIVALAFSPACALNDAEICRALQPEERNVIYGQVLGGIYERSEGERVLVRELTLSGRELSGLHDDMIGNHVVVDSVDERVPEQILVRGESAYEVDVEAIESPATLVAVRMNQIPLGSSFDDDAWDALFWSLNASERAIYSFSPIGACGGDALVYVIRECGDFCSEGLFVVLVEDADGWRFQAKHRAWIS